MARIRDLKKVGTDQKDLAKVQDNLEEFVKPIVSSEIIDGLLLKNVVLQSGENKVEHKLGREPIGWMIVNKSATADVWSSASQLSKSILVLNSSATVTLTLWVF